MTKERLECNEMFLQSSQFNNSNFEGHEPQMRFSLSYF